MYFPKGIFFALFFSVFSVVLWGIGRVLGGNAFRKMNYPTISDSLTLEFSLYLCSHQKTMIVIMENSKIQLQVDSQKKPATQPQVATQTGNQKEVVSKMNIEDEPQPDLNPLIRDKDYPAGVREWMMTATRRTQVCLPWL